MIAQQTLARIILLKFRVCRVGHFAFTSVFMAAYAFVVIDDSVAAKYVIGLLFQILSHSTPPRSAVSVEVEIHPPTEKFGSIGNFSDLFSRDVGFESQRGH
jgi:hypothetical protein